MEPMIASGNWVRPEWLSIVGFLLMFLLYTLGGLAIWHHRRNFMRGPMAIILFLIAIGYGFAVSLWIVDRLGVYEPYSQAPPVHQEAQREKPFPTEHPRRDVSTPD